MFKEKLAEYVFKTAEMLEKVRSAVVANPVRAACIAGAAGFVAGFVVG